MRDTARRRRSSHAAHTGPPCFAMNNDITSPYDEAHPIEKARNRLAATAFVLCFVVLLAAAYTGLQRRALLQELAEVQTAIAFWTQARERAALLNERDERFGQPGQRQRYVEARWAALLSALCVDESTVQRLDAELGPYFERQLREAQAAAASAGVAQTPTLRALRRSATQDDTLYIEVGTPSPWSSAAGGWCSRGHRPLGSHSSLPTGLLAQFAAPLADSIDLLRREELGARVDELLRAPPDPLVALLAARFSAEHLAEWLFGWAHWPAERSWLLDELALEPVPLPDKDPRGYRADAEAFDPLSATILPPPADAPARVRLAPIRAGSNASPTRYLLDAGKARARAAFTSAEFLAIAQSELDRLAQRRALLERRSEPESQSASWSGIQLPLSVLTSLAVLPAVGLYLLYAVFAAQVPGLPPPRSGEVPPPVVRDFWFPRLGSPRDPLSRPLPRCVQQALPRLSWLLFHSAPVALAYIASVLGLDPSELLAHGSLGQPIDGVRIGYGLLLVLVFHTAVQATSPDLHANAEGADSRRVLALQLLAWAAVAALPGLAVLGLNLWSGFRSDAWLYDGALLAALGAVLVWRRGRPSNLAWLLYGALVIATCVPYVAFVLRTLGWAHGLVP